MWVSKYWYEKLPMIYAVMALLCLVLLGRPGAFSATLFMAAAALTAWWRYSYRYEETSKSRASNTARRR
jgi:membrane protein implicated in regulation of membrane protease activity